MLLKIYYICFGVGCLYSVVSFILSGISDFIDFDGDLDFDVEGSEIEFIGFLPIKPFAILTFITVFGGTGIILTKLGIFQFMPIITLIPSIILGFIVAKSVYHFIYIPLKKSQTTVKKQDAAIGREATVLETILPGSFGRISYRVDNKILSAPAKEKHSSDGFKKGDIVIIDEIKDNIFYVVEKAYYETHLGLNK